MEKYPLLEGTPLQAKGKLRYPPQMYPPLENFFQQAAGSSTGPSAGSPSAAGASHEAAASTPPRKSAEEKAAARKTTLRQMGKMPAGSLVQLGDSPVH